MLKVVVVTSALLLAGCTGAPAPEDLLVAEDGFLLSGCDNWLFTRTYPAMIAPGQPPSGLAPGDQAVASWLSSAWRCERIHVGGLERGPIHMFIESHTRFQLPDDCDATAGRDFLSVLERWIVDDPDVATALREVTGFDVQAQAVGITETPAADWTQVSIDWGDGQVMTVHGPAGSQGASFVEGYLLSDPVRHLDLRFAVSAPGGTAPVTVVNDGRPLAAATMSAHLDVGVEGSTQELSCEL